MIRPARRDELELLLEIEREAGRAFADIGMRWGFMDAAHFSRLFRSTYGCTPSEYRRLHLA